MHVTICGGGNASHTLTALLASRQDLTVRVYSPFQDEAESWRQNLASFSGIGGQGSMIATTIDGVVYGRPEKISNDPGEVIEGAELILLALPAFAHGDVLKSIMPYIDRGVTIGALPARGGFDWESKDILNELWGNVTLFGFQTLPWACRIERYGCEVRILGTKSEVDMVVWPSDQAEQLSRMLSDLFKLQVNPIDNFISLSLANPGQIIHPGIMYSLFHKWDGRPYSEAPLFYQNVDATTAELLSQISDEIQEIRMALQAWNSSLDLSAVIPLDVWLRRAYKPDLGDASSVQSCFQTNRAYANLRAPMREVQGGWAPDFHARYLVEDVPYGLIVTRGIAELVSVETPVIDRVIAWSQEKMGKEYLVGNKMRGRDLGETRAPQRYGRNEIYQMIGEAI